MRRWLLPISVMSKLLSSSSAGKLAKAMSATALIPLQNTTRALDE